MATQEVLCLACGGGSLSVKRYCGDCGARLPVRCVSCASLQAPGLRYCEDCGTRLPGWCQDCGHPLSPGKRCCGQCGATVASASVTDSEIDGTRGRRTAEIQYLRPQRDERRLVTALFCDLVGFTPLTERLDTEQIRTIQVGYFDRMSVEIARFGGVVEKFAGDAVLALFGVPLGGGDDAERAVLCALALQEAMCTYAAEAATRWDAELSIRVGVNTGEAVSGQVDAGGRSDVSITGDVINTAARLQTAAEPGSIMVGRETMRLARRRVRFGEGRQLALKGKAQPVVAYQVLGLRERAADRETERRGASLVGRDLELGALTHAWTRARDGEGGLVALVADAGFGKSRLLEETTGRFAMEGAERQVWGRCLSHGQDVSLLLIGDILRSLLRLPEGTDASIIMAQLRTAVADLLSGQDENTQTLAVEVLSDVLGVPSGGSQLIGADARARRQALVHTLRLILAGLAERGTVALILEDVHWMDAASAEVLTETLRDAPNSRLLVLATYRPGWSPPWAEWGWVQRVSLRPLGNKQVIALAQEILSCTALSPDLERYIVERAGGSPYFVEELLHALQDAGGVVPEGGGMGLVASAAEQLPSTLTEIVLARLDRLEPRVRGVVQVASVIGRVFAVDLLARVADWDEQELKAAFAQLGRSEIVFPQPGSESEYAFKHVTMRDVAYHTLLQSHRAELHAAIARALMELRPTDEVVEVIAYHVAQTPDHESAGIWLERAGDRSAAMYANETAIGHYEEARRRVLLGNGDALTLARIGEKLGALFRTVAWYDEALEELEVAAETYRQAGDIDAQARVVARIGDIHFLRGSPEDAVDSIRDVLDQLDQDEEDDPPRGVTELYMALVDPLYSLNRFEDALMASYRAVELARLRDDEPLSIEASIRYGLALGGIGRFNEAGATLEALIPLLEETGNLAGLVEALMALGDIALAQGRPGSAQSLYERALHRSEDRGDLAQTAALLWRLGRASFILGDWNETRTLYERTAELVHSMSFSYFSAAALMSLGEHYLREGDEEKAARYLEEPFTIAERSGQTSLLPYLHVPLADWDVFQGRSADALTQLAPLLRNPVYETALDHHAMQVAAEAYLMEGETAIAGEIAKRGLEGAIGQGNRLAHLGWLEIEGEIAARRGQQEAAVAYLTEALDLARSMPYVYGEARVLVRLGRCRGNRDDLAAALEIMEGLGARPYAQRIRASLENLELLDSNYPTTTLSQ